MEFFTEFGLTTHPAIIVVCYMAAEGWKLLINETNPKDAKKMRDAIPVIVGIVGAVLASVAYVFIADFFNTDNILSAVASGILSGLAAVGFNQLGRRTMQLFTRDDDDD